jgi:8-oxo-dGTP pyrophosphatase MutT (NUDIX family)
MDKLYYRAAGGVLVKNRDVLLLDRPVRNEIRLPKGHIEEGESPAEAAVREVREEAGFLNFAIVADLGELHVQFVNPYVEREVVRNETYFLMSLVDDEQVVRKGKERQFEPFWIPIQRAAEQLTFDSEKEFVKRAQRWIEAHGMPPGIRCNA